MLRRFMSSRIVASATSGPIEQSIITKITAGLSPSYLKIANDSHKHAHHAGIRGASNTTESHFRLEVVSDAFEGKNMPSRHRMVYSLLEEEMKEKGVHALQMKTKTSGEWSANSPSEARGA